MRSRQLFKLPAALSKPTGYLVIAVFSFGAGLLSAGSVWLKTGYQWLPPEIVLRPPPPTATWCFPDYAFTGAERLREELARRSAHPQSPRYSRQLLVRSMAACVAASDSLYAYRLLAVGATSFSVLSLGSGTFGPGNRHTLLTEQGLFYLHPVPKRRVADYDRLVRQCYGQ